MKARRCKQCNKEFRQYFRKEGKCYSLSGRKYCLECSPYGQYEKNKKPLVDGKRQCKGCKEYMILSEFAYHSVKSKDHRLRSYCRPCDSKRVLEYQRKNKERAVAHLGDKCTICGYCRCLRSLQFHHLDPKEKEFTFGNKKWLRWEKMLEELNKCILLCANCHGEIHEGVIDLESSR
jgi:hypothetical protein